MPQNLIGKTISNTAYSTLIWASNAVIGYVFWLVMGRVLSPADFGLLTTVLAIYNILVILVTLNSMDVATKFLPMYGQKDQSNRNAFLTLIFSIVFILAIVSATVLYFLAEPLTERLFNNPSMRTGFQLLGGLILSGSLYSVVKGSLYSEQNFSKMFRSDFVGALARICTGVGFVILGVTSGGLLGWIAGFCVATVLMTRYAKWRPVFNFKGLGLKNIRKYMMASMASSLVGAIYMQSSTIMTGGLAGLTQAGFMGAAVIFSGLLGLPASIIFSAVLPMLSRLWAQNDMQRFMRLLDNAVRYSLLAIVPGLFIMWGSGGWIIGAFYSTSYGAANNLVIPYFLGLIISTLGGFYVTVPYVGNRPFRRLAAISAGTAVNLLFAWLLVPSYGALGAAWGFLLSSIVYTACSYAMVRMMGMRPKLHSRLLVPALGLWFTVFLSGFAGPVFGLLLSVAIGLPLYVWLALKSGSIVKGDVQIFRNLTIRGMKVPPRVADAVERWASY